MSYDVIARKWRPLTFTDVIGQDPVIRTLTNAIKADRVHHSLIFAGLRGTGKTSTARIFAKALNCENGPTDTPCLKCVACDEIARGVDMDVFEIDAASNKGVDDIRDLKEIVKFPPTRDRCKIFIIDEAHMLSGHAFNALLKTIEEPPAYVVFILATTEVHKIPSTIRSRCQLFDFRRIGNTEIRDQLVRIVEKEEIPVEGDALKMITDASEGSMRDAESLLDQIISFSGEQIREEDVAFVLGIASSTVHQELLLAVAKRDASRVVDILDELEDRNTDFVKFLSRFGDYLQSALHAVIRNNNDFFPEDFDRELLSTEDLMRCINIVLQNERSVRDAFSQRVALELMVLKMVYAGHVVPVAQLLAKKKSPDLMPGPAQRPSGPKPPPPVPVTTEPVPPVPAAETPVDEQQQEPEPDRPSPMARYAHVCGEFPHLGPFLNKATFDCKGDRALITFSTVVPGIIREELEQDFREALGRSLAKSQGHPVTVALTFPKAEAAVSERDAIAEDPLVKHVLESFEGEIEAITDKE